ncbi:MAG TPA: helix-turn-helix domain-containing protein [Rectinemataceae bacterium]|nr:helix-turn-helix domain-containing protein [Rectinemataceae bacterium]
MIYIERSDALAERLRICYNPLADLSLALDLLAAPEHHPAHLEWARGIMRNLSPREKETFEAMRGRMGGYLNLDRYVDEGTFTAKEAFDLRHVEAYLEDDAHWSAAARDLDLPILKSFLAFFWHNYVAPQVLGHQELIAKRIRSGKKLVRERGLQELILAITDRASFKDDTLILQKKYEARRNGEELSAFEIRISLFGFPHLVIADAAERKLFALCWDLPFQGAGQEPDRLDRLSRIAFALSDRSRLRLLLMLSRTDLSQKDLALQMGFAKSTISRHINILIDAGLILPRGGPRGGERGGERNCPLRLDRDVVRLYAEDLTRWLE